MLQNGLFDLIVKSFRPRIPSCHIPIRHHQVMHDITAAHNQHPFPTQRRQPSAHFKLSGTIGRTVDADHDDGYVSLRINIGQNGPYAVIKPPIIAGAAGRFQKAQHFCRFFRTGRRRITQPVQGFRKAVHIIDLRIVVSCPHIKALRIPVRRYSDNASRFFKDPAHSPPRRPGFTVLINRIQR